VPGATPIKKQAWKTKKEGSHEVRRGKDGGQAGYLRFSGFDGQSALEFSRVVGPARPALRNNFTCVQNGPRYFTWRAPLSRNITRFARWPQNDAYVQIGISLVFWRLGIPSAQLIFLMLSCVLRYDFGLSRFGRNQCPDFVGMAVHFGSEFPPRSEGRGEPGGSLTCIDPTDNALLI
jgi:hypothetical protein